MSTVWAINSPSSTMFEPQSSRHSSRLSSRLSRASSESSHVFSDGSFDSFSNNIPNMPEFYNEEEDWRSCLTAKLFVNPLENRYLCASCLRVLHHPVSLSDCNHHVCSGCLGDLCRNNKSTCPIDKTRFKRNECIADDSVEKFLTALELECPHKKCGCTWIGTLATYRSHYEACSHTEVPCPNGCNCRMSKRLIETHVNTDCPLRTVRCDFCKRVLNAQSEIEHLKDCPKLPVACPKSCGKVDIPRELLNNHLASECTLAEYACPYEKLGCSFKGSKTGLVDHVKNFLNDHVAMLCEGVSRHGEMLSQQEDKLKEYTETINDHAEKLAILNRESETQLLWKIENWKTKIAEAKSGKRPMLHSVFFYTGKHQYKLSLTLFPYGDKGVKGKSMSLYVRICRGEYDTLLPWPFSLPIDLIIIDQSQDPRGKSDFTQALRPNTCKDNLPFLGKPTSDTNPAFGILSFASLDLLETRDYVRDDVMFLRVCVKRKNLGKS